MNDLEVLSLRAAEAGKMEYVAFALDLRHHARMKEDILYPASLLVRAYLRLRLKQEGSTSP